MDMLTDVMMCDVLKFYLIISKLFPTTRHVVSQS